MTKRDMFAELFRDETDVAEYRDYLKMDKEADEAHLARNPFESALACGDWDDDEEDDTND